MVAARRGENKVGYGEVGQTQQESERLYKWQERCRESHKRYGECAREAQYEGVCEGKGGTLRLGECAQG